VKDRVSDFFATLWPLLMLLTLHLFFAVEFPPFINVYLLFGLILLTNLTAFYLYRSYQNVRGSQSLMVFRLLIFYLILLWLLYKLFSGEFFRGNFSPLSAGGIYTVFLSLISWSLTIFFAQSLIHREKIMAIFADLPAHELPSKTRQYSYELQEVQEKIKKIRLVTLVFTIVSLILLLGLFFILKRLYTYQIIVYLVLLVFCLSFIFFTKGLDEESLLISEGIRLNPQWTALKERRYFLILLALAIPAFLISSMDFSLPLSLIGDFFNWLDSLFKENPPEQVQRIIEIPKVQQGGPNMGSALSMLGEGEPRKPLLSDELKKAIKLFFIGCAGAAFLLFLVAPLLRRSSRLENKNILKSSFRAMANYFVNLIRLFKPRFKLINRGESVRFNRKRKTTRKDLKIRSRERDRNSSVLPSANKVLRSFSKIVRWGKKRGIPYRVGISPSDYLLSLIELIPHRRKEMTRLALFLNRYFYSSQIIDSGEIENFILDTTNLIKEERRK
jgi:hypothetical protein